MSVRLARQINDGSELGAAYAGLKNVSKLNEGQNNIYNTYEYNLCKLTSYRRQSIKNNNSIRMFPIDHLLYCRQANHHVVFN